MPSPELSVVLTATEDYATVRKTIEHLRRQTAAAKIELVLVARRASELRAPAADLAPFHSHVVVELDPIRSIGAANAAGVRAASAAVVALAEDHCFPAEDWAERILLAHRNGYAVVGPVMTNANPRTAVSWADFFIGYGPWAAPCASREANFLPGHNSSYKREVLLGYGPGLEGMLESETVLHWDLRGKGHRLYLDSTIRAAHTNYSLWSVWLRVQYLGGRMFAGTRLKGAPLAKRLLYAAASPLIPAIRLLRITKSVAGAGLWTQWLRTLPTLMIGLTIDGVGQAVGYLAGPSDAMERLAPYEFCRIRNITAEDRTEVFG
ncbi:MAG: glycosyltransferase [Bryobacterales bacterium]|nr:glycosyltransferase [Bryobacterales bacterium]